MQRALVPRTAAVVATLLIALVIGDPNAGAAQLAGVPDVVALGGVAPATVHPGDVVSAWPAISGEHSFVSVQLVDDYGGAHVLSGSPTSTPASMVPDWWPAGHYRLAAISVTAGWFFGDSADCFYCYSYYDFIGDRVYEVAYDDWFAGYHTAESGGVPFTDAEVDAIGIDVVNPNGDVAIADLDSASIGGGVDGAFPAGGVPRLSLSWGADARYPFSNGYVTVAAVVRGVEDPSSMRVWSLPMSTSARGSTLDLRGLPNGRYRISSVTLMTDDRYQLVASPGGSTTYPPRIGGGVVHADLAALRFSIGVPPDVTPPVLRLPGAVSAEASSASGAIVSYAASADDEIDGPVLPACAPMSGSIFPLGATFVSCTAIDYAGNAASGAFEVRVGDTTAPVLAVPARVSSEARSAAGAPVTFDTSASDLVDGAVVPVCTPAAGSTFALGATSVSCTATDSRGNATSSSFDITVVDTTPPAIVPPAVGATEAIGPTGAPVRYEATAIDLVDGAVSPSCAPASGSMFAVGSTRVTCSATDAAGNTSASSFDVLVVDTTPPSVHTPSIVVQEATSPSGAVASFESFADDLVDGTVASSCAPASGSTFALGTSHVTCTAIDAHGNTGTSTFDVLVRDTTAPVLTITGNAGTYDVDQTVSLSCTAADLVSTVSCTPASVTAAATSFGAGPETLTFRSTDAAGNVGTATATFQVQPTVSGMSNLTTAWVSKAQLSGAMVAKLRAGSYDAYRQQLRVQAGKAISPADAQLLIDLSYALPPP